jgi:hypothetical protein
MDVLQHIHLERKLSGFSALYRRFGALFGSGSSLSRDTNQAFGNSHQSAIEHRHRDCSGGHYQSEDNHDLRKSETASPPFLVLSGPGV